jgi:hypothetical protein
MNSKIYSSLVELGYELSDFGNHWRTKAMYRGGDNPTSVMIYKDTGVWKDFVANKGPMPFKKLVELTLNTTDYSVIKKYIEDYADYKAEEPKEKLEMEKIYPEECLKKLFPNYAFYEKRGISQSVQSMYKCGLASAGRMYRRIVFPIYNSDGQICGFSGRKVDEDKDVPKWKHIGSKNNWVYPNCIPDFPEINEEVILVESIGDSMALSENGHYNNLVMFGLDCSNALINLLVSKNLKRIYISNNNDSSSEKNRGLISSIKALIKLSSYFDLDILKIKPPLLNDFGEMQKSKDESLFSQWNESESLTIEEILNFIKTNESEFNKTKLNKFYKKCPNE